MVRKGQLGKLTSCFIIMYLHGSPSGSAYVKNFRTFMKVGGKNSLADFALQINA